MAGRGAPAGVQRDALGPGGPAGPLRHAPALHRAAAAGCWPTRCPAADFADLKLPFHCVAASIETASARWFSSGPVVPAVLASCAVPGLLPPVEIDGEHYFDGGLVDSIPVGRAVALGASTVYVLQVGRIESPLAVPDAPVGGRPGRVRDRPAAPVPRGDVGRCRTACRCTSCRPAATGRRRAWPSSGTGTGTRVEAEHRTRLRGVGELPCRWQARAVTWRSDGGHADAATQAGPPAGAGPAGRSSSPSRLIVLSPLLLVLAAAVRPGRAAAARAGCATCGWSPSWLVWLTAEIVALFMLLGPVDRRAGSAAGCDTEPYQAGTTRSCAGSSTRCTGRRERTYGLRVEVDEPALTAAELAARLARPVIVLPGTPGRATRSCSSTSC